RVDARRAASGLCKCNRESPLALVAGTLPGGRKTCRCKARRLRDNLAQFAHVPADRKEIDGTLPPTLTKTLGKGAVGEKSLRSLSNRGGILRLDNETVFAIGNHLVHASHISCH